MSQKLNSEVAIIGIDIDKNSFYLVGQDRPGALVLRQKWSRGQVEARLANLPPSVVKRLTSLPSDPPESGVQRNHSFSCRRR